MLRCEQKATHARWRAPPEQGGNWNMNHLDNKRRLHAGLARLAEGGADETSELLASLFAPGASWRHAHPINELAGGARQAAEKVWAPLKRALPDLERRDYILIGGDFTSLEEHGANTSTHAEAHAGTEAGTASASERKTHVAALGVYCGTFREDWLGIPATGAPITLRYGEVYEMAEGQITQANCLWDVADFARQAGRPLLPASLGTEGLWPPPLIGGGIRLSESDPAESAASIAQTMAMHRTLAEFDERDNLNREALLAMPQREHWHAKMMWYGPSGIGATRGLAGFVDFHQLPFRQAFKRPQGSLAEAEAARRRLGAGHYVRFGDGPFSVTGGWPSIVVDHEGGSFAGMAATGRQVAMRVMDFYAHHEGRIRENWIPLDMLHIFHQLGADLLERMKSGLPLRAL